MTFPAHRLAWPVLAGFALLSSGCNKPAELAFAAPNVTLTSDKGAPIPAIAVKNKDGEAIPDAPKPTLKLAPDGIAMIEGDKLAPMKNGKATLTATLEGTDVPPATLPVIVRVIDEVKLTCPAPCAPHVGDSLTIAAAVTGLGAAVDAELEWSSSDTTKATVNAGVVKTIGPGAVNIGAKVGTKVAEVALDIRPNVDKLILVCPWPPIYLERAAQAAAPTPPERSCEAAVGETLRLGLQVIAGGQPSSAEAVEWSAGDPSVLLTKGDILGQQAGGAVVEAKVAGLAIEMPIAVASKKKGPTCSDTNDGWVTPVPIKLAVSTVNGSNVEDEKTYQCQTAAAKKCMEDTSKELAKAAKTLNMTEAELRFFTSTSMEHRASVCCCR